MPLGTVPHESWASVYDQIYLKEFGGHYENLTQATLALILDEAGSGSRIVDFGAGTGRLSLPLAKAGCQVTAVDVSGAMLRQLSSHDPDGSIRTLVSSIRDFDSPAIFDFAICVFTVIGYITTANDLRESFAAIHRALKPGGKLLLDVPGEYLFRGGRYRSAEFDRTVTITPTTENCYDFHQTIECKADGESQLLEDRFPLRYWPEDTVSEMLAAVGFVQKMDFTSSFMATGASYWLLARGC